MMHQTFPLPTMTQAKQIRLTISVTPEVHSAFDRLAAASGVSMSRCMGEWLGDTLDAVEQTAVLVERARAAPKLAMREVHAYAMGLADETGAALRAFRSSPGIRTIPEAHRVASGGADAGGEGARARAGRGGAQIPPPCNTGGKVPSGKRADGGVKGVFPLPPAKVQAHAETNGKPPRGKK